jgi:hypothetical protein
VPVEPVPEAKRTCRHGGPGSHWYYADVSGDGTPRRLWCAGPHLGMSEPWRAQLEFQMTAGERFTFHGDEVPAPPEGYVPPNRPGALRHERLTTEELRTVQLLQNAVAKRGEAIGEKWGRILTLAADDDTLKDFTPLGWFGWGEVHWYTDTPIYDQLCLETGLYPAGNATHHGVTGA